MTGFLNSSKMVSHNLPIHSKPLKAIGMEIKAGKNKLKVCNFYDTAGENLTNVLLDSLHMDSLKAKMKAI